MNKKKLIAILTLVCFMFTLVPVAAMAEETAKVITVAGGELEAGLYKLTDDVALTTANLTIPEGVEVTIDLNGYTLTGNGAGSVIVVCGDLIIQDTSTATNGMITGGNGNEVIVAAGAEKCGGGVYVASTGSLILKSGKIANNTALRGGGVYVEPGGTFVMDDGEISGNKATAVKGAGGGGVAAPFSNENVGRPTVTINGGKISKNISYIQGGGIFSAAEFVLNDGIISENKAPAGGGIMANYTFTMNGGKITENIATGGIYNTENGGTFGHALGGGLKTISDFYLYGGEITNNKVINDSKENYMYNGGGIHANWQCAGAGGVHVKGAPIVSGNECVTGETKIADNIYLQYSADKSPTGVIVYLDGDLENDAVLPIANNSVEEFDWIVSYQGNMNNGKIISENDKVFNSNAIGIYFGTMPEVADPIGYVIIGSDKINVGTMEEFLAIAASDTLYLTKDTIELTDTVAIPAGKDIVFTNIEEKNVKITGNNESMGSGFLFSVPTNASLTIQGNITLDGSSDSTNPKAFSVKGILNLGEKDSDETVPVVQNFTGTSTITVEGGTVNLYSGKIINNKLSGTGTMGGAMNASNVATINIWDGEISGNESVSYGGAIVLNGSTLNMYDGSIKGNKSGSAGGGIHAYNNALVNVYGGTITGNTCVSGSGQVSVNTSSLKVEKGMVDSVYHAGNGYVFFTNGGTFEHSLSITALPQPTKNNFVFGGWYDSADFKGSAATELTKKKTYYAKWEESICTVTPSSLIFEPFSCGDTPQETLSLTVVSKDVTTPSAIGFESEYFDVTINDADKTKITVTPKADLAAGDYEEDIIIKTSDDATHTVTATVTVELPEYTVIWKNDNEDVLETDNNVVYGTTPSYDGGTPTKAATAQYTYTFKGWDKDIAAVTGNVTYTATYDSIVNKYTVTWVDEDGTELEKNENVEYGAMPSYGGATPTKAATAEKSYAFAGWSPTVVSVTGNVTYTATYTDLTNTYTVTWKNEDGTELEKDENVEYGAMPSYDSATPTKAEDENFTYTFKGWTPEIAAVTGNVTYTAVYDATAKEIETPDKPEEITPSTSSSSGFSGVYNYQVAMIQPSNGTITLSESNAVQGETVIVTATPKNGYGTAKVIVTDSDNDTIAVTDLQNGTYSFVMPEGKVSVTAEFKGAIVLKIGDNNMNVFGKTVVNDVAPQIKGDYTMLPIRPVVEALDGDVAWDADTQKITVKLNGNTVVMYVGEKVGYINGVATEMDVASYIDNSRALYQLRFVAEATDTNIYWNKTTYEVTLIPE